MIPHYTDDLVTLYHGDCLDVLRELPDAAVDAVVTDPPYGLEFMGKEWDAPWKDDRTDKRGVVDPAKWGGSDDNGPGSGNPYSRSRIRTAAAHYGGDPAAVGASFQAWCEQWATECLRVLKPGGHLLAFGGTRTWHRLACAVEDAGFEVRDSIAWLYGSGFPKSLDVSKAIDKAAGAERARTVRPAFGGTFSDDEGTTYGTVIDRDPITDEARTWQGWGTALKPGFEPVVVARKPLIGTVAANVLAHGTGALNIDGTRIRFASDTDEAESKGKNRHADFGTAPGGNEVYGDFSMVPRGNYDAPGRWPANVVMDESQAAELDRQSGVSQPKPQRVGIKGGHTGPLAFGSGGDVAGTWPADPGGGASRFFYVAKAPTAERPRDGDTAHPTVKPLDLMRWLVRLVTPPGGVVLEPFAGSGTTAEACVIEGFRCIAIEREADYLPLIVQRLTKPIQPDLFGGGAA